MADIFASIQLIYKDNIIFFVKANVFCNKARFPVPFVFCSKLNPVFMFDIYLASFIYLLWYSLLDGDKQHYSIMTPFWTPRKFYMFSSRLSCLPTTHNQQIFWWFNFLYTTSIHEQSALSWKKILILKHQPDI